MAGNSSLLHTVGLIALSWVVGIGLQTLFRIGARGAEAEPSLAEPGFPRTYRPAAAILRRQARLLLSILAFFVIMPVWTVMEQPKDVGALPTILGAVFLPVFLLLGWLAVRAMTIRVVLDADSVGVATFFGTKTLAKGDVAGVRRTDVAQTTAQGSSLPWLREKGCLTLVPQGGRPLTLPCGLAVDAAFDAWIGGLPILDCAAARAWALPAGTPIRDAAGHASAAKATGKPVLTFTLLAVLAAMFACETVFPVGAVGKGSDISLATLVAFGGVSHVAAVEAGQWFRLLSAVFLHQNLTHLLLNGFVLLVVGMRLEQTVGRLWLAALFLLSGVGGSLMSITANPPATTSVGASGAIMGLLAAALILTLREPAGGARTRAQSGLGRLLIPSLLPAAASRHIDVADHVGGAIAGAILAVVILSTWRRESPLPRLRPLAAAIIAACLLVAPVGLRKGIGTAYNIRAIAERSDAAALADLDRGIALAPEVGDNYFTRGAIRLGLGQYGGAASDFQANIGFAPAYGYNTLLLHLSRALAGADDGAEFARNAAHVDLEQWPGPILAAFLGKIPPNAVSSAALVGDRSSRDGRLCEASFYMGEYEALHGQQGHGGEMIRRAAATCPRNFLEYRLARAEARRLAAPAGVFRQ